VAVSSMTQLQNPTVPHNIYNMNPALLQQQQMAGGAMSQMGVAEPPK